MTDRNLICYHISVKGQKCPIKETYIIEIKPKFNYQNKNTEVVLKVKWLYSTQNIYVNIVKPVPTLFKSSFTPINYLYTDTTWNTDKKRDRKKSNGNSFRKSYFSFSFECSPRDL